MIRRKLLIVVGAGASIDFGMPSVADIGEILSAMAQERFPLLKDSKTNLYDYVAYEIEEYWSNTSKPSLARKPHFEAILYGLVALRSAYTHGVFTSPLGGLVKPNPLPDINWLGKIPKHSNDSIVSNLIGSCADTVIDEFRRRCCDLATSHAGELEEMRLFVEKLSSEFEIAVITLNYDNVLYRCLAGAPTTGFTAEGNFDERLIFERKSWPCFLHLHGSVHFDMQIKGTDLHMIHWKKDLSTPFTQNASGRSGVYTDEGIIFPQSAIVAGYGKTSQILRRPFRTYYSEIDRLITSSDALLCLGFGFGDEHLNLALNSYRDARRRPVVIIDWAKRGQMSAAHANWDHPKRSVLSAMRILMTDLVNMNVLGHTSPVAVDELIDMKSFDICRNAETPLAIWYNGMLEACRNPNLVLHNLR